MSGSDKRPIIIRRKKVVKGHHGGSWKIALADFMTALMALFLVMWILSNSSEEQKKGVAEYFATPLITAETGQDGGSSQPIPGGGPDPAHEEGERARIHPFELNRPNMEQRRFFQDLKQRILSAINADPELRNLRDQMRFDLTMEGLRIQLMDTEDRPMFAIGSAEVAPYMRKLLRTMAPLMNELPNEVTISGYTDSRPFMNGFGGYSNWELSTARANASRRELVAGGFSSDKLLRVAGFADEVPLSDTEGSDPMNRRIELLVLFPKVADAIRSPVIYRGGDGEGHYFGGRIDLAPVHALMEGLNRGAGQH